MIEGLNVALALIFIIIAVVVAVLCRTVWPYIKKVNEAIDQGKPAPPFNTLYILTGLFAALVTMFLLGLEIVLLIEKVEGVSPLLMYFVLSAQGFGLGWMSNDILNTGV